MVSCAVLAILVIVLGSIANQTGIVWRRTSGEIEQFRAARNAFDAMTRRLSEATLNTYWDYDNPASPTRYIRQSELRFISGPMNTIAGTPPTGKSWATHGVFFQTPVGFSTPSATPSATGLEYLLNTWGYFVEFGDDKRLRPSFVTAPSRYRYRLCEFMQPTNDLNLYSFTSGNKNYMGRDWFTAPLNLTNPPVHSLADNIIALIFVPKLSAQDDQTGATLAPELLYDSTLARQDAATNSKNQLPPVIQATLVAIEEKTAIQMAKDSEPPDFGLGTKFGNRPGAAADVDKELEELQKSLSEKKAAFRVFTSNILVRSARWSTEQTN